MAELNTVEFRAMGGPCRVVVAGGPPDLSERAQRLVAALERRWSRFRDDSEISALNRMPGGVAIVSDETYLLVERAEAARRATGGRFNPLMLDQLERLGYDRSWPDARREPRGPTLAAVEEPIALHPVASAVRLPSGCRFDPGGIGKGLAADLAVELCLHHGATTVSVELGGDIRAAGVPWNGETWQITVTDPDLDAVIATFTPAEGAVTTSTTERRRWVVGDVVHHHVLDPRTGRSARTDLIAVTTCSSRAWWAQVTAKVALMAGSAAFSQVLGELRTPGVGVTSDRRVVRTDGSMHPDD
ncbi:MAG: FAD:protein FMN transferase [Acidimicrobiales bacterium]